MLDQVVITHRKWAPFWVLMKKHNIYNMKNIYNMIQYGHAKWDKTIQKTTV